MKKGELTWDLIVKVVLAILFLIVVLLMVYAFREKLIALGDKVRDVLRFGR